jgi:tetratricopeptide (TPR) repeat protein
VRIWIALIALAVIGGPVRAGAADARDAGPADAPLVVAPDEQAAFDAALQRLAAGDPTAIDALIAIADRAPTSPWADDALAEAARGAERAGQLARALALDQRIVRAYPDSRQARRAQARVAELSAAIGADGTWAAVAAEHDAILRAAAGKADPSPQRDAMIALVQAHPDYPEAFAARMWIGDTFLRQGEPGQAGPWFDAAAAAAPAPRDAWRARKASADARAAAGDDAAAEAAYLALRGASAEQDGTLDQAETELAAARGRRSWILDAWILLAAALIAALAAARRAAGSWPAALRGLARPPLEFWFALPIAAVLIAVAWRDDAMVGVAVTWIAGGGLAIGWLSGASLALARARGPIGLPRAAIVAAIAAVAVVAVAYLAITQGQLIDLLIETWKHGHERR